MKCQKCEKAATFHITEITDGDHVALHLCADCAEQYLKPSGGAGTVGEALAQHLSVGQTSDEMAKLDQKACPVCGITYYEFRKYGRLGCPHDYVHFEAELESLIVNIHGEVRHRGKRPPKPPADAAVATELIRLRREMKEAIDGENYELASQIRDRIRRLEKEGQR
ncbi:MAG TPA: DNA helicase UvrBC [Planctomycetaceae bacterium]|nr:DNA helicase UvrBC [Planctomycetaceae bacterium]HRF02374.1 UvrB/UvrC motif-containing protein [Pirellulaceae bacterium]